MIILCNIAFDFHALGRLFACEGGIGAIHSIQSSLQNDEIRGICVSQDKNCLYRRPISIYLIVLSRFFHFFLVIDVPFILLFPTTGYVNFGSNRSLHQEIASERAIGEVSRRLASEFDCGEWKLFPGRHLQRSCRT